MLAQTGEGIGESGRWLGIPKGAPRRQGELLGMLMHVQRDQGIQPEQQRRGAEHRRIGPLTLRFDPEVGAAFLVSRSVLECAKWRTPRRSRHRYRCRGTFKQVRIADRGSEAQQYRASGLNLLIAAIVYWNSTYMTDAVAHLRATGETVPDDLLVHTSPVGWEHIGLSGDFLWDRSAAWRSACQMTH